MELFDTLTLDAPRKTRDGYLVASVKAARTGIQIYSGREVDPDNSHGMRDKAQVRVYRPESEVFSKDSLTSYAYRPITNNHPTEMVTADNWRDYAVGVVGGDIVRDGESVRVPMVIMDAATIAAVEGGKNQISQGYMCDLAFDAGRTDDGLEYDAVQRNIRANHTAIVGLARGGPELKIGDAPMPKTVTIDGHAVEVSDAAAIAIAGLEAKLATANKAISDHAATDAKTATEMAAKDAKIATLEKELADAKAKELTGDAIDKLVAERATLVADAKKIGGDALDVTGSNADIKKRAVLAKLGDAYKDKDAAFFDVAFDLQIAGLKDAGAGTDAMRDAIKGGANTASLTDGAKKVIDARAEMIARMNNGGKDPDKAATTH